MPPEEMLVYRWIAELACTRRYNSVLEHVERQTAGGLQSLGVAPVRLLAAAMVTAVTRHHCQHFHSAVDILRSLYDAGCHGDASDACVSYRRYAKLSAGLKVLGLYHQLKETEDEPSLLARLNAYFPRHAEYPSGIDAALKARLTSARLHFRAHFLSLVGSAARRDDYFAARFAAEFGAPFRSRISEMVSQFVERIESCLPRPAIEQMLEDGPDSPLMRQLSRQACAPFEILIDCIHRHLKQPSAERPRLSEDDLLSVLDTLLTGPEAAGGHGSSQLRRFVLDDTSLSDISPPDVKRRRTRSRSTSPRPSDLPPSSTSLFSTGSTASRSAPPPGGAVSADRRVSRSPQAAVTALSDELDHSLAQFERCSSTQVESKRPSAAIRSPQDCEITSSQDTPPSLHDNSTTSCHNIGHSIVENSLSSSRDESPGPGILRQPRSHHHNTIPSVSGVAPRYLPRMLDYLHNPQAKHCIVKLNRSRNRVRVAPYHYIFIYI